jgi:hypothetical protein
VIEEIHKTHVSDYLTSLKIEETEIEEMEI